MHREVVDLSFVMTSRLSGPALVAVGATGWKANGAGTKPSSLALDTGEPVAVVDDQVVASVLAERYEDGVTLLSEGKHHGERGPVANVLGVFHVPRIAVAADGN
jgi:hypothetical protein